MGSAGMEDKKGIFGCSEIRIFVGFGDYRLVGWL